ncbi:flavin reductase family protein [Cryptosporangium sp. NPDC051539]|uniref:flavin reductase family protein n=1 Tax=Cryptosporangium sp. NPDC051539 TaxID=3363962 RepID=UPI0037BA0672
MTAAELAAEFDPRQFRDVMGQFATGVAVLTVRDGDLVHASTVNSLTSVSLRPALLLVCLAGDGLAAKSVRSAGRFALTILGADQLRIARRLADRGRPRGRDQLAGIGHTAGRVSGAPLLDGGIAFAECTVAGILPAGDHDVVLAQVEEFATGNGRAPLTFHGGTYGRFERLPEPGCAPE